MCCFRVCQKMRCVAVVDSWVEREEGLMYEVIRERMESQYTYYNMCCAIIVDYTGFTILR